MKLFTEAVVAKLMNEYQELFSKVEYIAKLDTRSFASDDMDRFSIEGDIVNCWFGLMDLYGDTYEIEFPKSYLFLTNEEVKKVMDDIKAKKLEERQREKEAVERSVLADLKKKYEEAK